MQAENSYNNVAGQFRGLADKYRHPAEVQNLITWDKAIELLDRRDEVAQDLRDLGSTVNQELNPDLPAWKQNIKDKVTDVAIRRGKEKADVVSGEVNGLIGKYRAFQEPQMILLI